jgi:ADP-ribose diphosphatase
LQPVELGCKPPRPRSCIELKLVTPYELATLILSGEFVLQLHIGALMLAGMRGHFDLAVLR